jgi:hypothetical protein
MLLKKLIPYLQISWLLPGIRQPTYDLTHPGDEKFYRTFDILQPKRGTQCHGPAK